MTNDDDDDDDVDDDHDDDDDDVDYHDDEGAGRLTMAVWNESMTLHWLSKI